MATALGAVAVGVCLLSADVVRSEAAMQTIYKFFDPVSAGAYPFGGLSEGGDGVLYGTTTDGGSNNWGTVFKITKAGALTNLFSFNYTNGAVPRGLTFGDNGLLYGVTSSGGGAPPSDGTIFRCATNGALTNLVLFNGTNGSSPNAMVKGSDGWLYGTTQGGGQYNAGTVFKIASNGIMATLSSFNGTNGSEPGFALVEGPGGRFYGTTLGGGSNGLGTIYAITTNGTLTTMVHFDGTNGHYSSFGLILGSDHNFYGATSGGGAFDKGTVFRMAADGAFTNLLSFDGTNGYSPIGTLAQAHDGSFYGTTANRVEGTNITYGTLFKATTNGELTTVVRFDGTNGINPLASMVLADDGNLYGTMGDASKTRALDGSYGSIVRLVEMPAVTSIAVSNGSVKLTWTSFTNGVYRVEYKPSLGAMNWTSLPPDVTASSNADSITVSSAGAQQGYYRVALLP
jgi:uncharacterized repeat protein (TIGR03803 family)